MTNLSNTYIIPFHFLGLNVSEIDKRMREQDVAEHGLGVATAAIFLAGEMAGSGVLALPNAMIGTSKITHHVHILAVKNNKY